MTWRSEAAAVVRRVIAKTGREDMAALRRAIRAAYPFGERAHYPYKVWCEEVRRQLGQAADPPADMTVADALAVVREIKAAGFVCGDRSRFARLDATLEKAAAAFKECQASVSGSDARYLRNLHKHWRPKPALDADADAA